MAERWGQQQGFNLTVRLGHLAIRAHGVVVAQRIQSIQRMAQAHTKTLLALPGGKRKLKEAQVHLNRVKQILKDSTPDGE